MGGELQKHTLMIADGVNIKDNKSVSVKSVNDLYQTIMKRGD